MTTIGIVFFIGVGILTVAGLGIGYTLRWMDDNQPMAVRNK